MPRQVESADLKLPKSQAELTAIPARIRAVDMERSAALMEGTLDVVSHAIGQWDAKSLELSTRAATNLDKLTVSASGEAQKVDVTGIPPVTHVDLKVLITDLLGRDAQKALPTRG